MDFTTDFLRAKGPCAAGFRWYLRHQQPTSGYQHVLDALVDAGRIDDACWLLDQLGPTNTLLEVDRLDAEAVVFAGTIRVRRGIDVGGLLRAGRSISCEGGAIAARAIVAGGDVITTGALESAGPLRAAGVRARWIAVRGSLHAAGDVHAADALHCGSFEGDGDLVARGDLAIDAGVQCEGRVKAGGDIACGGPVQVRLGIECGGTLRCAGQLDAGWGVRAGGCVIAAGAIRAGEGIRAGGELRAGPGYGIYAGTAVAIEDWATSAVVCACTRPRNLLSGDWQGADVMLQKGAAR
jgi:predicted acyltransferase (DUF342 family)